MRLITLILLVAGAFVAAIITGCGSRSALDRSVVSGEITYQGKPVSHGELLFLPEATGPISGGRFAAGEYRIDAHGGVPAGNYRVEIKGYRQASGKQLGPGDPNYSGGDEQILPAKYNIESELKLTIEPSNGTLTKDFILE